MYELMIVALIIIFIFIYGSFVGYFVHWLMHTQAFKSLAKAHDKHHQLYTPEDFISEKYRDAKKDNSAFVFIPIIAGAIILACVPLWSMLQVWWIYPIILVEGVAIGWLNDYIHYAFHIKDHWLNKYSWFFKLKYLHLLHHIHPTKNHGIIWFGADKLFRTFTKEI